MRNVGVLMTIVVTAALLGAAPPAHAEVPLQRYAGADRIGTAVEVARAGWERSDVVLLATASAFPDALAASALAAQREAPLLLTHGGILLGGVRAELERLRPSEVIILGGGAAVAEAVADEVRALPHQPVVRRIAGPDRWRTAAAAAAEAEAPAGEALIVSGENYPDAVSAAALTATAARPPVLLTQHDRLPDATREALLALRVERVTVIGGTAAVGQAVVQELEGMGMGVTRLAGDSRFTTSVAVAEEAMRRFPAAVRVVFATGQDFPDALSAGALATRVGGPVVIVPADAAGAGLDAFLRANAGRWSSGSLVGGRAAISVVGGERLRRAVNDLPSVELTGGREAVQAWFTALDSIDGATLLGRSSGTVAVYADYVVRTAALGLQGPSAHRVIREPSVAQPLGGGLHAIDMEVEWRPAGGDAVRIGSFAVRQHADGHVTVEDFIRAGRPLREYVLDGAALGLDAGDFAVDRIRWFRRADIPVHEPVMVMRITNRRSYPIYVDDLAAGLETRADGAFYSAGIGLFPEIPAGATRDIVLSWEDVRRSDGGAWVFFMVYGPSRIYEYEYLVDLDLPAWPRS
jgi:putative cell wall-binding protein